MTLRRFDQDGIVGTVVQGQDISGTAAPIGLPAVQLVDATGAPAAGGPGPGGGAAVTWTQIPVTLVAATSATLIAANANRRALRWMVTGSNPMTVVPGAGPAVAGTGMNYSPGSGVGFQGGADGFSGEVSTQAFTAISTLGTTVAVWEGV